MLKHRPLHEIAADIRKDWSAQTKSGVVPPYADAYLRPLETLTSIHDNYHMDSAKSVVLYLLSNMHTYRGERAKELKSELRQIVYGEAQK